MNEHEQYVVKAVDKRLASTSSRKDLMTQILRYKDETGIPIEETYENCSLLVGAGSETTATTLCGTTCHLLKHS
ncbi:hypothetical protein C7974DRAFT_386004 [Boeremia exigua]|uniref:uncharacterized protein n=1 Tax=Boeremia exigua TaxID=749465 RepID=UPI001E8CBAF3|nr:uncharacterized protein C7974DRAFT_386004 [Boeremia exigua]KAH6642719.1 hypothetical protein C7974DRAFT_386004 [Boeremia exigua]